MSISDLTRPQFENLINSKVEEELNNMSIEELRSYYRNNESELYEYNPTSLFDSICEDNQWEKDKVEEYMRQKTNDETVVQYVAKYCVV